MKKPDGMILSHTHVLITRPLHQAQSLSGAILERGGQVTFFPTLEIQPVKDPEKWIEQLSALQQTTDFFIFVSANAVFPVLPYLKKCSVPILAVGPATEAALIQGGLMVQNKPDQEFSTEGLLKLPELHSMLNKRIVIFSGEQSKPILSETLRQRGAKVLELEVYRRVCPSVETASLLEKWQKTIDIVVSTSQESLKNWSKLLGKAGQAVFGKKPLIVISSSMQSTALNLELGDPILLARNATDMAILEALEMWSQYAARSKSAQSE